MLLVLRRASLNFSGIIHGGGFRIVCFECERDTVDAVSFPRGRGRLRENVPLVPSAARAAHFPGGQVTQAIDRLQGKLHSLL